MPVLNLRFDAFHAFAGGEMHYPSAFLAVAAQGGCSINRLQCAGIRFRPAILFDLQNPARLPDWP